MERLTAKMSKCKVCGKEEGLVQITYKNPDGSKDVEFYCKEHGRIEFQKAYAQLR